MKTTNIALLAALACTGSLACEGGAVDPGPARPLPHRPEVEHEPISPIEGADGRRVRRLTAEQWNASLTVATGQTWSGWAANAANLGRPDFTTTTEEGEQLSVVFEQLTLAAARETCADAVEADREGGVGVILGALELDAADEEAQLENLRRLLLRFHGHHVEHDDDARLAPWRSILDAPMDPADLEGEASTPADVEALKWEAICIGLATHSDFLTY